MRRFSKKPRQIEDVIDVRKELGQFDEYFQTNQAKCDSSRYAHSAPVIPTEELKDNIRTLNIEGDLTNIGPTDSEITLVRVKREGSHFKTKINKWWDLHDKLVPGDGRHLGESPSLVNLVTLVHNKNENNETSTSCSSNKGQEYLIPLSSWEPNTLQNTEKDTGQQQNSSIEVLKAPEIVKRTSKFDFPTKLRQFFGFKKLNKTTSGTL